MTNYDASGRLEVDADFEADAATVFGAPPCVELLYGVAHADVDADEVFHVETQSNRWVEVETLEVGHGIAEFKVEERRYGVVEDVEAEVGVEGHAHAVAIAEIVQPDTCTGKEERADLIAVGGVQLHAVHAPLAGAKHVTNVDKTAIARGGASAIKRGIGNKSAAASCGQSHGWYEHCHGCDNCENEFFHSVECVFNVWIIR